MRKHLQSISNDSFFHHEVDEEERSNKQRRKLWKLTLFTILAFGGFLLALLMDGTEDNMVTATTPPLIMSQEDETIQDDEWNTYTYSTTTATTTVRTRNVQETVEYKLSQQQQQAQAQEQDTPFSTSSATFPVIEATDDDIIDVDGPGLRPASETLECRESVIDFVINATDAKDECDGLKKAFDMTCNSDSTQEIIDGKETTTTTATEEEDDQASPKNRRRRLFESDENTWRVLLQKASETVFELFIQPSKDGHRNLQQTVVENEITATTDQAQVEEAGTTATASTVASDNTPVATTNNAVPNSATNNQANPTETVITTANNNTTEALANTTEATVNKQPSKPKQSLSLPTTHTSVSDQMLSETLLLQKEDTIQTAIAAAANHTNNTLTDAAVDAVVSAKAVQDTTAVVSAVLNDPTSVEARTCCASILNVFHENCDSPDEETVSDQKLFLIIFVIALCGVVKSLIRHFRIRWLPEAAGCILVGGEFIYYMRLLLLRQ